MAGSKYLNIEVCWFRARHINIKMSNLCFLAPALNPSRTISIPIHALLVVFKVKFACPLGAIFFNRSDHVRKYAMSRAYPLLPRQHIATSFADVELHTNSLL